MTFSSMTTLLFLEKKHMHPFRFVLSANPSQRRNNKRSKRSKHNDKIHKRKTKGWHNKRMRKECDIGDKMFMNSSSKESFKHEGKTTISHLPFIT